MVGSVGLLMWVFVGVGSGLRQAAHWHWGWAGAAMLSTAVMAALAGLRWTIMLRVQGVCLPWHRVTAVSMAGLLLDAVLPGAAGGDVARALLLRRHGRVPVRLGLLTLVVDHLSGLLALVTLAIGFTAWRRDLLEATPLGKAGVIYLAWFLLGAVGFTLFSLWASHADRIKKMPAHLPGTSRVRELAGAFHAYAGAWRQGLAAALVSVPLMLAHFTTFYCGVRAVGVQVAWADVMALMPVVDAVALLPVSLSGLGVREALFAQVLGPDAAPGLAAIGSLLGHACLALCGVAGWLWLASIRRDGSSPDS